MQSSACCSDDQKCPKPCLGATWFRSSTAERVIIEDIDSFLRVGCEKTFFNLRWTSTRRWRIFFASPCTSTLSACDVTCGIYNINAWLTWTDATRAGGRGGSCRCLSAPPSSSTTRHASTWCVTIPAAGSKPKPTTSPPVRLAGGRCGIPRRDISPHSSMSAEQSTLVVADGRRLKIDNAGHKCWPSVLNFWRPTLVGPRILATRSGQRMHLSP